MPRRFWRVLTHIYLFIIGGLLTTLFSAKDLNEANDSKFVTRKWNISMINQKEIMMQEIKLSITQKY